MKKNLQRFFSLIVFFFLLLSTTPGSAGTYSGSSFLRSSKKINNKHSTAVTITAPVSIQVNTDPWSNTASEVSLGTPSVITENNAGYTVTNNAPVEFPIGTTNVVWTATDDQGNTATAIQTVTVTDIEKPIIFRMGEISVVNDAGRCGAIVKLYIPNTYDNSGKPVTLTNNAPSYFSVGSVTIIWTATDIYGNSDTSTQKITVIDNELPTISTTDLQVSNTPGKCGATVNLGTPVTADNCGVVSVTNDAPAFFPVGTTLVHWTVTDKVGYTNTSTQKIVVTDTEKPVIASPVALTLNNTAGKCGAAITLTAPVVTDNCGVASITNNAPALIPAGTTIVTWTAVDKNGNTTTTTQTVVVKDVEAPVLSSVPANVTVSCGGIPAVTNPVVSDNCTASPAITFSQVSTQGTDATKTAYYNYTITRTWVVKDAANNTATAKQVITVADKTAPVITVPANITVANDLNVCGATVKYTVSVVDNCSSAVIITYSKSSNTLFATGITIVTITAKDVSGNLSSQSFTVTVTDTQKPTVKAPSNVNTTTSSSSASNVSLGTPTTSDNCAVKSVTNNAPSSYPVGVTTVTWTATDNSGNTGTATQTVTVVSTKKKSNETAVAQSVATTDQTVEAESLQITVAPNPSTTYFTLKIEGRSAAPVDLRVVDISGRVVDAKSKLAVNSTIQIGHQYIPGTYFATFTQGTERKVIQLLKLR